MSDELWPCSRRAPKARTPIASVGEAADSALAGDAIFYVLRTGVSGARWTRRVVSHSTALIVSSLGGAGSFEVVEAGVDSSIVEGNRVELVEYGWSDEQAPLGGKKPAPIRRRAKRGVKRSLLTKPWVRSAWLWRAPTA